MPFERIVRPYQLPRNTPPVRLASETNSDPQPVTVQIGRVGSGKTLTGAFSASQSVYLDKAAVEQS